MAQPKFQIGQIVEHDTRSTPNSRPNGPYEIVRVLPAESGEVGSRTYRIKSSREAFERSTKEYEIVAVDTAAGTAESAFVSRPRI